MSELAVDVTLDGQCVDGERLDRVQHDRHLLVLHDLHSLGATIKADERVLSDKDIDFLDPEAARRVSIATRQAYDIDGITHLYKTQLNDSDEMWKQAAGAPAGAPPRSAAVNVSVVGLTLEAPSRQRRPPCSGFVGVSGQTAGS